MLLEKNLNDSDSDSDKGLVIKLFYRTLERSLLSSYVVQEIKSLLRSSVSDEDLITAVCKAVPSEKVEKLLSAVQLLTKQVPTLHSEINYVKGDGYKTNVSDNSNSGDRLGINVILCKTFKDNN